MAGDARVVIGGVDTHARTHHAAVIDAAGRILGTAEFDVSLCGYRELLAWLRDHGRIGAVGVEGTGSYGAGLCRHLLDEGVDVIEVDRPDRRSRRARGKSDPIDAESAARAVLAGTATTVPKDHQGVVESIRMLRIARSGAVKARTAAVNALRTTIGTAPERVRVTAGQNPERLRSDAAFARLCGVAPVPASSGRTSRHRLSRGGDRQANRALHMAVVVRLRRCPRTRAYVDRRTAEGLSKSEIMRCLKRYLAREVYHAIREDIRGLDGVDAV